MAVWRKKRREFPQNHIHSLGTLVATAGCISLVGYAIPSFDDFSNPDVSRGTAILGIAIIWSITVGAFVMAFRFLKPPKTSN
jgi:hypothetical protein